VELVPFPWSTLCTTDFGPFNPLKSKGVLLIRTWSQFITVALARKGKRRVDKIAASMEVLLGIRMMKLDYARKGVSGLEG